MTGKLRTGLLSALNGAVYSAILWCIVSWQYAAAQARLEAEGAVTGLYFHVIQHERWTGIATILILLFVLSAYAVRQFTPGRFSAVLFWELVGLIAVSAWNVFLLTTSLFESFIGGKTALDYWWVRSPDNALYGALSLGLAVLVNLIYGSLIRLLPR